MAVAQVKIFRGKDEGELMREINDFLREKKLQREQVTLEQSESYGDRYRNYTITLLYNE
jgi:hypothetical protein